MSYYIKGKNPNRDFNTLVKMPTHSIKKKASIC